MDESILISIKKSLGIAAEYTVFDADIIMHINSVFMILNQLGVGPYEIFRIEDDMATWADFVNDNEELDAAKSYIYLKVKMLFDPPTGTALIESNDRIIRELEWRLNVQSES